MGADLVDAAPDAVADGHVDEPQVGACDACLARQMWLQLHAVFSGGEEHEVCSRPIVWTDPDAHPAPGTVAP